MPEKDGWPAHFEILPNPIKRIGKALLSLVTMHQLSPISDHEFKHPLDEVFDSPPYEQQVMDYGKPPKA